MKEISRSVGIHEYTGDLILHLALGAKMKEYYTETGISDEIYYNTLTASNTSARRASR